MKPILSVAVLFLSGFVLMGDEPNPNSPSLEPVQGMTSITAARCNLLRRRVPRSTNPGSS